MTDRSQAAASAPHAVVPNPLVPLGLGAAGLLPFLAGTALTVLDPGHAAYAAVGLVVYGVIILAFLGGVHWGRALVLGGAHHFVVGVTPSLIGLFATFLPLSATLAVLSAAFVLAGVYDALLFLKSGPRWYAFLRIVLTFVVACALAAAAFAAPDIGGSLYEAIPKHGPDS